MRKSKYNYTFKTEVLNKMNGYKRIRIKILSSEYEISKLKYVGYIQTLLS